MENTVNTGNTQLSQCEFLLLAEMGMRSSCKQKHTAKETEVTQKK